MYLQFKQYRPLRLFSFLLFAILVLSYSRCKQSVQNHEGFWPSDPKTIFRAKQRLTLSAHKIVNLIPLNTSQIIFASNRH